MPTEQNHKPGGNSTVAHWRRRDEVWDELQATPHVRMALRVDAYVAPLRQEMARQARIRFPASWS